MLPLSLQPNSLKHHSDGSHCAPTRARWYIHIVHSERCALHSAGRGWGKPFLAAGSRAAVPCAGLSWAADSSPSCCWCDRGSEASQLVPGCARCESVTSFQSRADHSTGPFLWKQVRVKVWVKSQCCHSVSAEELWGVSQLVPIKKAFAVSGKYLLLTVDNFLDLFAICLEIYLTCPNIPRFPHSFWNVPLLLTVSSFWMMYVIWPANIYQTDF